MNAMNLLKHGSWAAFLLFGFTQASCSQISFTVVSEPEYYPGLPIFIQYVVKNEGTRTSLINSTKQGSPWITPVDVATAEGRPIEPALVSRASYSPRSNLKPSEAVTGRIDVARFFRKPMGYAGLEPGEYSLSLSYQFGTNIAENVRSAPVHIRVSEPKESMREAIEWLHRIRERPVSETNSLPAAVLSEVQSGRSPYWLVAGVEYARWLTRAGHYEDALSIWQDLFEKGNTAFTDIIEIRLEVARCYESLGLADKAEEQLESLASRSESAFGWMHFRKNTPSE